MLAEQPLISVVVTTFNGEKYLAEQIDSILGQTYQNIEVIIADDASTDGTRDILAELADADSRIRLFLREENQGLVKNLEKALEETSGELIAISDQDDIWELDKLELLYRNIGGASGIYSDSWLMDSEGNLTGSTVLGGLRVENAAHGNDPMYLLYKNHVSGHALLFRKEILLLPFVEKLIYDHQLGYLALAHGGLKYFGRPLVKHRIHGANQVNASLADESRKSRTLLEKLGNKVLEKNEPKALKKEPQETPSSEPSPLDSMIDLKVDRRREKAIWMRDNLFLLQKLLHEKGYACPPSARQLMQYLSGYDNKFFDIKLFVVLLKHRHQVFYGQSRQVKSCFRLSKGRLYYEFVKKINPFAR